MSSVYKLCEHATIHLFMSHSWKVNKSIQRDNTICIPTTTTTTSTTINSTTWMIMIMLTISSH